MGVHSRTELLRSGVGRSTISRRVAAGTLHRVLPSVYSTRSPEYLDLCRAVTVWKPDAVLSHDSAAWLWGLLGTEPAAVHATIAPAIQYRSPRWVKLHRRTVSTVVYRDDLPVVTAEQGFLDVATSLNHDELDSFVDRALTRSVHWRAVAELCDAAEGQHGIPAVREQLRRKCSRTKTDAERQVARALAAQHAGFEINGRVGRYFGDLIDRRTHVIVRVEDRPDAVSDTPDDTVGGWLLLRFSEAAVLENLDATVDEIMTRCGERA